MSFTSKIMRIVDFENHRTGRCSFQLTPVQDDEWAQIDKSTYNNQIAYILTGDQITESKEAAFCAT